MKPSRVWGTPSIGWPRRVGSTITQSASIARAGSRCSSPSRNSAGEKPARSATRRSERSVRTACVASGPKSRSGSSSGVTSATRTSSRLSGVDVGGQHQRELDAGETTRLRAERPRRCARGDRDRSGSGCPRSGRCRRARGTSAPRALPPVARRRMRAAASRTRSRRPLAASATCCRASTPTTLSSVTESVRTLRKVGEIERARVTEPERLGNREWPIPEPRFRRHELHLDELGRELVQCERRLECCDTAARDHDAPASAHAADHRFRESRLHRGAALNSLRRTTDQLGRVVVQQPVS